MYQTIREFQTDPQSVPEILALDERSFVPFISSVWGFRDYTCIDDGNGVITSTSVFRNRADCERFDVMAVTWVNEHLGALLPTAPRVVSGEVRSHVTAAVLAS